MLQMLNFTFNLGYLGGGTLKAAPSLLFIPNRAESAAGANGRIVMLWEYERKDHSFLLASGSISIAAIWTGRQMKPKPEASCHRNALQYAQTKRKITSRKCL